MPARRHCVAAAFVSLAIAATEATAAPRSLTVTTLNIRFYGQNGEADGVQGTETRDPTIKAFFAKEGVESDVMIFEEIVDVNRLVTKVLENRYRCHSYNHPGDDSRHQHVVICVRPPFALVPADDDDNLVLEQVNAEFPALRPGMHGIVTGAGGRRIAHVIGLHLKAGVDSAETRDKQVQAIADYIKERDDELPVIITGDMNTHGSDPGIFSSIFADADADLVEVPNPATYTFRVPDVGYKFDRFWITHTQGAMPTPDVKGPCNVPQSQISIVKKYYDEVSDHCPVRVAVPY